MTEYQKKTMKPAFTQFIELHKQANDTLRLGQRFCNMYTKGNAISDLFYEEDEKKAISLIKQWLEDHEYYYSLPRAN